VELATRLRVIEADAAGTVDRARSEADERVAAARAQAAVRETDPARAAEARGIEDAARERTRAADDARLHREHEERLRALLRLLPQEREKTDRSLLTERERSDEAISNRDDFLSIVSHDLRSLLNMVSMGAQLIAEEARAKGGEESESALTAQRIVRAASRMNRLVGDLMDVSSIESGKLGLRPTRGDATALIAEAIELFGPWASAKGVSLKADRMQGPVHAHFDHDRILQVLGNLIGNAIKFTAEGGQIRVGRTRKGGLVTFTVQDTGAGIPESQLEAVFQRFWQVGDNDRRGLGLGLYIARGIVEAHGGRIWAESRAGEGSVFRFTLAGHAAAASD
jgi:signal transduction histidine kinase